MQQISFLGQTLASPVIAASGTFGYGSEYKDIVDITRLGGICSKGITMIPKSGNEGERLYETPSGLINSIGLENPGVEHFIANELPIMRTLGTHIFANLGGGCIEDYEKGAELLSKTDIDFIELNISCPNVKQGGIAYGVKAQSAAEVVSRVRKVCTKPLIVKLSPNAENIPQMAQACEEAGADALSLVNTFMAMAIDIKARKAVFNNIFAGLSGPCIRPIALRMVYEACRTVKIPVIGLGGIASAEDALSFIMAGASCIEVGTATFTKPDCMNTIIDDIEKWMRTNGVHSIDEIKGAAQQ